MEKLLKVEEIADLLQVSKSLVYKWVHYEYIPCVKIGSGVRFREKDVECWVARRTKKGRLALKLIINRD